MKTLLTSFHVLPSVLDLCHLEWYEKGEIDIRINPNSERTGEFILTHEITHVIDTKEMQNLVIDYANKNSEFNEVLEALKQTYGVDKLMMKFLLTF